MVDWRSILGAQTDIYVDRSRWRADGRRCSKKPPHMLITGRMTMDMMMDRMEIDVINRPFKDMVM